ncbi:hypothetical protein CBL_00465 [Carabus blaptoides fortunei]
MFPFFTNSITPFSHGAYIHMNVRRNVVLKLPHTISEIRSHLVTAVPFNGAKMKIDHACIAGCWHCVVLHYSGVYGDDYTLEKLNRHLEISYSPFNMRRRTGLVAWWGNRNVREKPGIHFLRLGSNTTPCYVT